MACLVAWFIVLLKDELTSDENIFFGLSQALQKFPKDIGANFCASNLEDPYPVNTLSSGNVRICKLNSLFFALAVIHAGKLMLWADITLELAEEVSSRISYLLLQDRVLCYFCFKNTINANSSTKATTRTGQSMVRSIILLKGALDHLPNLREVHTHSS